MPSVGRTVLIRSSKIRMMVAFFLELSSLKSLDHLVVGQGIGEEDEGELLVPVDVDAGRGTSHDRRLAGKKTGLEH